MLGMKTYTQDYVDACRARVEADLRAYRKQVGKAPSKEFEVRFFNDQVLLLDHMFVHRLTGIEGKDGNPLNEVLKLRVGDDVKLSEADFVRLSKVFFAAIEKKYL